MVRVALLFAPLFVMALAACGGEGAPPVAEVAARWNTSSGADVKTLVRATDVIFVGEVTAKSGQREVDRFPVSRFSVSVDEGIMGAAGAGDELTIEQPGGLAEDHDGRVVQVALEGDEPIVVGVTYLFFARLRDDGVYTTAPFGRFELEGGRATGAEAWARLGAVAELDGADAGDALETVRDAAR